MNTCIKLIVLLFLFSGFAIPVASAQTLYTIEGDTPMIGQFVGLPPVGCTHPNGPVLQAFLADQPSLAGVILPFVPPPNGYFGDVAVDLDDDWVWATDGLVFNRFDADGNVDFNDGFVLPAGMMGAVTGLGCDSETDWLWVTDGFQAAAVTSPGVAPWIAGVAILPFPFVGLSGVVKDIEWDPNSGTLWVVTNAGELSNHFIGGAVAPGGTAIVAPSPLLPGHDLTGLGINTGGYDMLGFPDFYVTDGSRVAHIDRFGGAAPLTFYFPHIFEDVWPVYGIPEHLSGLAFSLRPVTYGEGGDLVGGAPVPAISATGQSCCPNPTFQINVKDATPDSTAYLAAGIGYLCPPDEINTECYLYVDPLPFWLLLGPCVVAPDGTQTMTIPIPAYAWPDDEIGVVLYLQWLIGRSKTQGGGVEVSEGLSMTLGMR
jgi:hypothetical protein